MMQISLGLTRLVPFATPKYKYYSKLSDFLQTIVIFRHLLNAETHWFYWVFLLLYDKYKYRQTSLKDTLSDGQDMFVDDAPSFFQLLNEHFGIQEFIPSVFRNTFYQHFGRKRDYSLEGSLSALIPYNPRSENSLKGVGYNEYRYPTCQTIPPSPWNTAALPEEKDVLTASNGAAQMFIW